MFDLAVLPDMLEAFLHRNAFIGPREPFDTECYRMACAIGRPDDWWMLLYPFWLSLDNCRKHPHIRKMWLRPRLTAEQQKQFDQYLDSQVELYVQHRAWQHYLALQHAGVLPAEAAARPLDAVDLFCAAGRDAWLDEFKVHHRCTYRQWCYRQCAYSCPWLRIVFAEQFMPLTPSTPEYHMKVEHMVGTVKGGTHKRGRDEDDDGARKQARYWQNTAREVVAEKGNGPAGLKHVQGSARKLPATVKVVSADEGEVVVLEHTFTHSSETVHVFMGLGGKPLPTGCMAKLR